MTDAELMRAVQAGDTDAFGRLVHRYHPALRGYLLRLTRDHHLADDLVQETFLRVFTRAATFRVSRPFRPWLYRIAVNLYFDHRRGQREVPRSRELRDGGGFHGGVHMAPSPAAGGAWSHDGDHTARLIHEEERHRVRTALAEMTDDERALLLLRFDRELPLKEIAEVLSVPLGTVKSRLFRALRKFRDVLDAQDRMRGGRRKIP